MPDDSKWKDIETFGGTIEGVDDEGFLQVFGPEGDPLFSANAGQLLRALLNHGTLAFDEVSDPWPN